MTDFRRRLAGEFMDLLGRLGFRGPGRWRAAAIHGAVFLVFGFLLPWTKGVPFLDSVILGAYACMGVVFTAPAAAAAFDHPDPGRVLARIAACAAYGCAFAWTMLVAGVMTVYFSAPFLIGLDLQAVAESVLFGAMLSTAAAALAVWLTLRFSPRAARGAMRGVFLALLLAFVWYSRWLPDIALRGAAIAGAVAAVCLALLMTPAVRGSRP
jgi:hypothetical protein